MRSFLLQLFLFFPAAFYGQDIFVEEIRIEGNRHTEDFIILREMPFSKGDTLDTSAFSSLLAQAEQNIFNTHLFNRVEVSTYPSDRGLTVMIKLIERWYIWPIPVLELMDPNINLWWQTKDFGRLNYGFVINHNNFRGRREKLYLKLKWGFTKEMKLTYKIPYINNEKTIGLRFQGQFQVNNEINYTTRDNSRVFFKNDNLPARQFSQFEAEVIYRPGQFSSVMPRVSYTDYKINDSLAVISPEFLTTDRPSAHFMQVGTAYSLDKRDVQAYALTGSLVWLDATLRFGMDNGLLAGTFKSTYKKFSSLADRWYASGSVTSMISFLDRTPYFVNIGLGYDDYARGYELYFFDARHYFLAKSNLKFALLPQRNFDLTSGPDNFSYGHVAIYVNAYADIAFADDPYTLENNELNNSWLPGYGVGVDFVTYYDKILRLEVSMNKLGETGLFLHFHQSI
jgi:hypothetical protein